MKTIIDILRKNLLHIAGASIGALGGFLYWYFIGCTTGSCPLKSSPTIMIVYGSAVGLFIFSLFKKKTNEE